jgi:hypothetical protein
MIGWLSRDIDNQGLYEFWDREPWGRNGIFRASDEDDVAVDPLMFVFEEEWLKMHPDLVVKPGKCCRVQLPPGKFAPGKPKMRISKVPRGKAL